MQIDTTRPNGRTRPGRPRPATQDSAPQARAPDPFHEAGVREATRTPLDAPAAARQEALRFLDVPMKVVSDLLGHASYHLTANTYSHVTDDLKKQAAEGLNEALFPLPQVPGDQNPTGGDHLGINPLIPRN